jgi:hypothetical protein
MARLNTFNEGRFGRLLKLSAIAAATVVIGACNVGKTDTVAGGTGTSAGGGTGGSTGGGGSTTKSGCTGSYVGNYSAPEKSERIRLRNLSLAGRGIAVTGNDDIDNANAGGGPPDGGIWMAGSYAFETDANCNIIAGKTLIFYAFEYDISGTVGKSGLSTLTWSGQGSVGELTVAVDQNNNISGQFFHPAPDTFVYGVMSGVFTPNGKI